LYFLVGAVFFIWLTLFYQEKQRNLLVNFFDIGQGDAIFVEAPGGNQILIDGGPGDRVLAKLGEELPFWDRSLDLLVLTHPHADHLDGLLEVLKRYKVGMVVETGDEYDTPEYQEWRNLLREKNIPVVLARFGQEISLGGGVRLDIFYPFRDYQGVLLKNPHEANIVSRLSYGRDSFLFTGDGEKATEYEMLFIARAGTYGNFLNLSSDVLKVGHHGSKTSSSEDFARAVGPNLAVISAGKDNSYGHPHQATLDTLAKLNIPVSRTDEKGDIKIESDGEKWWFK